MDGQSYDVYLFVPEDEARLDNFIDLHERKSGAAVPLTDDGVVITEKFSDEAGLSPGDTLDFALGAGLAAIDSADTINPAMSPALVAKLVKEYVL